MILPGVGRSHSELDFDLSLLGGREIFSGWAVEALEELEPRYLLSSSAFCRNRRFFRILRRWSWRCDLSPSLTVAWDEKEEGLLRLFIGL